MTCVCSTETYRGSDKFDYWAAALHEVCGDFSTHRAEKKTFTGSISLRTVGGIDIARITTNADKITRSRKQIANSNDDYCFMIVQLSGRSLMCQDGREAALEPRDATFIESGRPSEFRFDGPVTQLSVHLPRKSLENRLRSRNITCAEVIKGGAGMGGLISNFISDLYDRAKDLSLHQGTGLSEAVLDLAQAALTRDTAPGGTSGLSPTALAQLKHIQNFIEARLPDPTLTPSKVAAAYGISSRHLHRIFQRAGTSVGEWIRQRRLEKCRTDLADPRYAGHGIIQIAFHWGFNDASHFSRAFKAHFGVSPREYRVQEIQKRLEGRKRLPPL